MPDPRRSPCPEARQRDAERSRRLLLDAALHEFAAKGYAGARVQDIADRAGVNKQLISYYFGGKEGLYRELGRQWHEREAGLAPDDLPLAEVAVRYLRAALADPCPGRLMLWQGLADDGSPADDQDDLPALYRRQTRGELADDLDPPATLLAIMGMVMAPVAMPQVARRLLGVTPGTPEFEHRYGEVLRAVVRRLAQPAGPTPPDPAAEPPAAHPTATPRPPTEHTTTPRNPPGT